jgi:hypothetical protein
VKVYIEDREDFIGNGDPAKTIKVDEKLECSDCGQKLREGDYVVLYRGDNSFYHKNCCISYNRRHSGSQADVTRVAISAELIYCVMPDLDKYKRELREKYRSDEDVGEVPDEDTLRNMAEKRRESDVKERDVFYGMAHGLGDVAW